MWKTAAVALGCLAAGCSELPERLPTGPTSLFPSASPDAPTGAGRVLRTEQWTVEVSIRAIAGASCRDPTRDETRTLTLTMTVHDDGSIAMRYGDPSWPESPAASWTGWVMGPGFEASGVAYEGLPCSGSPTEPNGAPTSLTGTFADPRTFTALEMRRYLGRAAGEVLYYLEWRGHRG